MIHKPELMKSSRIYLITLLALAFPLVSSSGQTAEADSKKKPSSESAGPKRFWQASFPGGNYLVALDRISSISKHCHLTDQSMNLTEVIIDTGGKAIARFYCLEPATGDPRNGIPKAGPASNDIASSSSTLNYRVLDLTTLEKLHESVCGAWISNKGKRFTIHLDGD